MALLERIDFALTHKTLVDDFGFASGASVQLLAARLNLKDAREGESGSTLGRKCCDERSGPVSQSDQAWKLE